MDKRPSSVPSSATSAAGTPAGALARMALFRQFVERSVQPTLAEYALLLGRVHEHHYTRNTYMFEAGQFCDQVFFLSHGVARHFYRREGVEGTTWFSFAGDVMTDPGSFFQREPREASPSSLIAVTDVYAFSMSRQHLQELYDRSPTWERFGRLVGEQYLLALADRALFFQFKSARQRYEELLRRQPALFQHVPLSQIASYLGIAPETLSRLRAER